MPFIEWNVLDRNFGGYWECSGRRTKLIEEFMSASQIPTGQMDPTQEKHRKRPSGENPEMISFVIAQLSNCIKRLIKGITRSVNGAINGLLGQHVVNLWPAGCKFPSLGKNSTRTFIEFE